MHTSLPGLGILLAAEFLAAVGDTREGFTSADQLAAVVGLAPMARDSGKRAGDDRRMREVNSTLNWVFYRAAFASLRSFPESRAFYDRERVESKMHNQVFDASQRLPAFGGP